jgi:hypothetical protein
MRWVLREKAEVIFGAPLNLLRPIISRIPGALSTERSHAGFAAIDKASFDRTRLASGDVTLYLFHQVMAAATRREVFRRSPVPSRRTQAL